MIEQSLLVITGAFVFVIGATLGFLSGCYAALQFIWMNGFVVSGGKIMHKPLSSKEIEEYFKGNTSRV